MKMRTVTPTELRSNIYQFLEDILITGIPLEINKGGKNLRIIPVEPVNKLDNLILTPMLCGVILTI
jgi:hypothetical protein